MRFCWSRLRDLGPVDRLPKAHVRGGHRHISGASGGENRALTWRMGKNDSGSMIGDELVISSRVQDLAELMPSTSNNLDDLDMDYSSIGRGASAGRQGDSSPSQIGDDNDHAMQQLRRRSCGEASSSSSSTNTTTRRRTSSRQSPIIHPEGEALRTSRNSSAWRQNERRRPTSTSPRWERGQPSSDASSNARALTRLITNCSRTADLYSLWTKEQGNFNRFHVAAMFSCLAKAFDVLHPSNAPALRSMLPHLDKAFVSYLDEYSAREVSTTVWAWGHLAHVPDGETWSNIRHALLIPSASAIFTADVEVSDIQGVVGHEQPGDSSSSRYRPLRSKEGCHPPSRLLSTATPQALALLSWGLHHIRCHDDDVWEAVALACRSVPHALKPRDLANVLWAFASAGRHDTLLFSDLACVCIDQILDFTPQDLSNTAWAYAAVGHPYGPLFSAIGGASQRLLGGFTPQGLANLVWSFASVRTRAPELFESVAREAMGRLQGFTPAQATMMAWAFAYNPGPTQPQLLISISRLAAMNLEGFKTKELTLLLWSLSRCGHHEDPLFLASAASLLRRLSRGGMGWQDMAHTVWAYASAGKYDRRIFSAVSDACHVNLPGFVACPAALDTVVGSLSSAGHYHGELFHAVAQQLRRANITAGGAEGESQRFHDQNDLASLARDLASVPSWDKDKLSEDGMRQYPDRDDSISSNSTSLDLSSYPEGVSHRRAYVPPRLFLKPAQAANLLAALATMNHRDELACASVVSGLKTMLTSRPEEVPSAALANCLWAMAVLEYWDAPFMKLAFSHVAESQRRLGLALSKRSPSDGLSPESGEGIGTSLHPVSEVSQPEGMKANRIREHMQLLQAALWLTAESNDVHRSGTAVEAREVLDALPKELIAKAASVWKTSASSAVAVSLMQKEVQAALVQHLHLSPQMERLTPDGMFSMDMVVRWKGQEVAVEVNGPQHYAQVDPEAVQARGKAPGLEMRPTGFKVLRDRLLASRGFPVANVSWLVWERVSGRPSEVQGLLTKVLNTAVAGRQHQGKGHRRVE